MFTTLISKLLFYLLFRIDPLLFQVPAFIPTRDLHMSASLEGNSLHRMHRTGPVMKVSKLLGDAMRLIFFL